MSLGGVAPGIIALAGLYLLGLGLAAIFRPRRAASFLGGFASSARAHYLELSIRLAVGFAFVEGSSRMPFTEAFALFGWVLIASSVLLLLLPWGWHRSFAERVVPTALRHLTLIGIFSLAAGVLFMASAIDGASAY